MKTIYEATIGAYTFQLVEDNTIEVWSDMDNERPESFIFLKDGSIKNRKDFDYEIMLWATKNSVI